MENMKSYLKKLNKWGEETKNILQHADIPENERVNWKQQINEWQSDIETYLNRDTAVEDQELHLLQTQGERIFEGIKKKDGTETQQIAYGKHQLPPLPYRYDALEPYISEQIMRLHHQEHHQSYVDGLNKAEKALYIENKDDMMKHWLREQAFHGSGHNLHTIFWSNMTPNSTKRPIGEVADQINKDFDSFRKFKKLFTETASSVEGVGWAALVWNPRNGRLAIQSFEKHQQFHYADTIPLLVLDMWEHAYYLQYQTDKQSYINNWWNVVNWEDVNDRYKKAKKVKWQLY